MDLVWDDIEERTMLPGLHGKFIHTERMTFALWRFEPGASVPLHSHPHEQVAHFYSGEFEFTVDGKRHLMTAGTVMVIPPGVPHEGRALTEVRVMDVFSPVREDYRDGTGSVLTDALRS